MTALNSSVHNSTIHIFPSLKVKLYAELFYAIIPTLFPCFLLICYISLHLVKFLVLSMSLFCSRCMLDLKFTIYHRAASLSSSVDVLAGESFTWLCSNTKSAMDDKTLPTCSVCMRTNHLATKQKLLLKTAELENGIKNEAILLQ